MIKRRVIFIVIILSAMFSNAQMKTTRKEYIIEYKDVAIKEMKRSGIPASITLAQGILESDNGNSTLATKANNHFGIKCHNGWTGKTYRHDDDKPNECFRKYKNANDSYRDHSDFLTKHQRYAFLFEFKITDYKSWARGLKKAGYATHSKYDKLLIGIIEDNELYKFDNKKYKYKDDVVKPTSVLAENLDDYTINPFGNEIKTYNRIEYTIAKEGDTYESIAEKNEIRPWQVYKYNDLSSDAEVVSGKRVYLQPKRRKAGVGDKYHTIQPGENLHMISQMYGIKLKSLYKLNGMDFGREPEVGYTISLRKKKK